ncbi:hypothetical protein EYF80_033091 [Liparis tanakae]|uniref:Uncharacterized protein n=1 Tax=Liparis tanakae TaxID=230148 RepID=A0A4Z2GVS5_9TELE|nr:hypothetical protein EYF80_033091 [Liparis tanakae]
MYGSSMGRRRKCRMHSSWVREPMCSDTLFQSSLNISSAWRRGTKNVYREVRGIGNAAGLRGRKAEDDGREEEEGGHSNRPERLTSSSSRVSCSVQSLVELTSLP